MLKTTAVVVVVVVGVVVDVVAVVDAVAAVFVCIFGIDGRAIFVTAMCLRYLLVLSSVGGTASHSTDSSSLALKLGFNWNKMLIY